MVDKEPQQNNPQDQQVIWHNKLVRDRIPELIRAKGEIAITLTAEPTEYRERLRAKLIEEVLEYLESSEPEELADILEVINALTAIDGVSREELYAIQLKKRNERGGFENRTLLKKTR